MPLDVQKRRPMTPQPGEIAYASLYVSQEWGGGFECKSVGSSSAWVSAVNVTETVDCRPCAGSLPFRASSSPHDMSLTAQYVSTRGCFSNPRFRAGLSERGSSSNAAGAPYRSSICVNKGVAADSSDGETRGTVPKARHAANSNCAECFALAPPARGEISCTFGKLV